MKKYKLKMVPTKQGAFVRRRIDKTRARAEFVGMLYLLATIALTALVCAPLIIAERYAGGILVFYKTLFAFNYSTVADAVKLVTAALYALMLLVLCINVLRSLTHLKYLFKKKVSRVYGLNSNISAMEALGQIFSSSLIWIVAMQFISYMICFEAQFTIAALLVAVLGVAVHILGGFLGGKVSAFYIDDEEGVREVKRPYGRIIPLVRNILQIAAVGAIGYFFTKTDLYVIASGIAKVVYAGQWNVLLANVMGLLPSLAETLIGLCLIAMARYALGTYEYSVEGEYSPDGVRGVSSACFKGGIILTVLLSAFTFVYRLAWGGVSYFAMNEAGVFEPVFHGNSAMPTNYFDWIPLYIGAIALVIFLLDVCIRWRWTKAAKEEQALGMVERRPVPPRVEVKMPAIQPAPVNVEFPKQEIIVRVPKPNPTPINVNVPKAAPIKLPDITVNVPKSAPIKLPDISVNVPKQAPIHLPDITVNVPKQAPIHLPDINVTVPKQDPTPIEVKIPKQEPVKLPDITVNVPKQAPIHLPDINVTVPKQDPTPIEVKIPKQEPVKLPDITVNVPKQAPIHLPDINVTVPKQDPTPIEVKIPRQDPVKLPDIMVNVPKQQATPIEVKIPKMAAPTLPPITVNVPKQQATPIQVNVPKQANEIPAINVNIPKQVLKPVLAIPSDVYLPAGNVSKRSLAKGEGKRVYAAQPYGRRDFELYVAPGTEADGVSVAAQPKTSVNVHMPKQSKKTVTPIIVTVPKQDAQQTPIIVNVPKQGKAETTPIVVNVPKQAKAEATPIVVNVPKQAKAEATPIVVNVPKQAKAETTPIVVNVPKQNAQQTPIVVNVPKQGKKSDAQTIVVNVPEQNEKKEATPIVVNVPKQNAQQAPIVVNVPKQAKTEATPIVVNVPKQAKAEATPIVVNVPKQNAQQAPIVVNVPKQNAQQAPIVVNVPKQAKAEATPIVVNVPKQNAQQAPVNVYVPKQEKAEATPIVVNVPKQNSQQAPVNVYVPKQEKAEATPIVVNVPKQNGQQAPVNVYVPKQENQPAPVNVYMPKQKESQPAPINIYMPKQKAPKVQSVDNAEVEALRRRVAELERALYKENARREANEEAETKYTRQVAALQKEVGVLEGKLRTINPLRVNVAPTPVNVQAVAPVNVVVKKNESKGTEGAAAASPQTNYRPFIMPPQPMMPPVMMMPPPPAPAPAPKAEPAPEPVVIYKEARNWEIKCPNCGKLLKINDKSSYHRCPACAKVFQIETKGRNVADLLGVNGGAKRPDGMKEGLPTELPPKRN